MVTKKKKVEEEEKGRKEDPLFTSCLAGTQKLLISLFLSLSLLGAKLFFRVGEKRRENDGLVGEIRVKYHTCRYVVAASVHASKLIIII